MQLYNFLNIISRNKIWFKTICCKVIQYSLTIIVFLIHFISCIFYEAFITFFKACSWRYLNLTLVCT